MDRFKLLASTAAWVTLTTLAVVYCAPTPALAASATLWARGLAKRWKERNESRQDNR